MRSRTRSPVILADHTLPLGYGYQWWMPEGDRGEFSAIGIYNHEIETIAFLRTIAQLCN